MNKKESNLIPKFRFPEFSSAANWEERKLFKVLNEHGLKSTGDEEVFSVSVHKGVINQIEHLGRRYASEKTDHYKRVLPGDIIYTKSPTGDFPFGIIKQSKIPKPVIVSPLYGVFTPETIWLGVILDSYFEYPERTINYLTSIIQKGAKNTINIKNDVFLSKSLILPTNKNEQEKIASCLTSLDELISALNQKLDFLKDHKNGLIQNLFPQDGKKLPKYRFSEFMNDGNWIEKELIDTADKKVKWSFTGGPFGSNLKASDYNTNGIRIIQLQNIGEGEFKDDYKIYTSIEKADELLSCNIYSGDIIISKMGDPVGRACLIPEKLERCVMASDGIRLVVNEKLYSKYFIYSLINSQAIRKEIEKKATGTTRKRIGLNDLKEILLILPKNIKEQQKIGEFISTVDILITEQTEQIENLKLHKKGLMQGLFPKVTI